MKEDLAVGATRSARYNIDRSRTIDFMGEEARVYATPELVRDLEHTCRDLLLEFLEPGQDSVGTHISVDHLAPTLLGMWVEITANVVELDRRKVTFEITAQDNLEQVARGKHVRFIADVNMSVERFKSKAEKAGIS